MSILNMDDASSTPRVLPRVFADVPSAAQVKEAEEDAARAKRAAGRLTIVAVLVTGALVAVTAFLMFTLSNQSSEIVAAQAKAREDVTAAQNLQKAAEQRAGDLDRELAQLKLTMAPVKPAADLDGKIDVERTDIQKKLNLPAYSGARRAINYPEGWNAYEGPFVWTAFDNTDWHTYVITNLSRRLERLQELHTRINNWRPPTGGGGTAPVCPDNQPNCNNSPPQYSPPQQ